MQPEFNRPEFLEGNSAEEIHERMMNNLPDDIDDMPGGFPYDMTMPAALEKDEIINFHIVRALMISFPEYAWDEWLDLHGRQVHLTRHEAEPAFGYVKITAAEGTEILSGVEDFETFTMNGKMQNITLKSEEYPDTGTLNFG